MYPNTNLKPGQTGAEVKKLQDFLVSQGLMTPQQVATGPGVYGPQTTAAVQKYQEQLGVDNTSGPGYWGPRTIAAASGAGASKGSGTVAGQPYSEADYAKAVANHPIVQKYTQAGNTPESIQNAADTGDFSNLVNEYGQPFSIEQQQEALKKAQEDNAAYYDALKQKETTDTETALAQKQADYQDYLLKSGQQFEADKATADQSAANQGVLFSGSRVQKEKNLQRAYEQDQASKLGSYGRDVANTAQDYQYKYGNDAANSLSKYYQAGGNTYNPNVASGGVGSSGLSSIYNPSSSNYTGTRIGEQAATANQRAAKLLTNKANKLLSTGYSNQL